MRKHWAPNGRHYQQCRRLSLICGSDKTVARSTGTSWIKHWNRVWFKSTGSLVHGTGHGTQCGRCFGWTRTLTVGGWLDNCIIQFVVAWLVTDIWRASNNERFITKASRFSREDIERHNGIYSHHAYTLHTLLLVMLSISCSASSDPCILKVSFVAMIPSPSSLALQYSLTFLPLYYFTIFCT